MWTRTGAGVGEAEDAVPSAFHARQHRAERLVRGRIVLLGDAAHEISPIGGQGMNVAWIGAVRLAVALTERSDAATTLAAYERATARTAARAQARAQFNMAMGAPLAGPALAARDLAIRAVAASPWSGRLLETMTMGGL